MNTDPITLAREVAEEYAAGGSPSLSVGEVETTLDTLARAVLRAADLADELDREGNARMEDAGPTRAASAYAHAARIRTALNGDPHA